jgi:glycosyltransferase involved in cell wall biosynthesis
MKILFFRETELKNLNPTVMNTEGLAGTENSIICLAHELSQKHSVKVIAPQLQQKFFDKVEYIPFQSYAEVFIHFYLFKPDIFIVSGNPNILFQNYNFHHVCNTIFWQQNHPLELEHRFDIPFILKNKIATIVAPSPQAATYYNKFYNSNEIIGIYNGVRNEFFNTQRNPIKNKITYCGSFSRAKGLDLVLSTAKNLPEYDFFLCGSFDLYGFTDEPYKQYCLQLSKSCNNLHFTGKLNAKNLAVHLETSSLCIANPLPNNNETCCISALEAIVTGTPVITGNSEILDSIISHGGITTENLYNSIKEIMSLNPTYNNTEFKNSLKWCNITQEWESKCL